jgi:5-methylcytosine-specific restriction protein B
MVLAHQVRRFVIDQYINPARAEGRTQVTVRAGTIHKELKLEGKMPIVCASLDAEVFLDQTNATLIARRGPPQGATAEWVWAIN